MDELISIPEAARRLGGLSPQTVAIWLSKGKLQRTKVGGRTMIRASELERVIMDRARPTRQGFAYKGAFRSEGK